MIFILLKNAMRNTLQMIKNTYRILLYKITYRNKYINLSRLNFKCTHSYVPNVSIVHHNLQYIKIIFQDLKLIN